MKADVFLYWQSSLPWHRHIYHRQCYAGDSGSLNPLVLQLLAIVADDNVNLISQVNDDDDRDT